MIAIIQNYRELKKMMGALINKSGYKNSFLAEKIGIQATLFSVKKQRGNWTDDEMEKILSIIENEELEDFYMIQTMKERSGDVRYPIADLEKEMGW